MINDNILKIRKSDIILTASIIVLCIVAAVLPFFFSTDGSTVEIYVDGVFFTEKNLSEDSETDVDGLMSVIIENGLVRVENSVCPSGACEHSLPISKSGESIICLPNKIMIKISGEGETDAISG
ncbi:MAG: NusG domain II-containing protein [Clostridia bacterium]|nr:NusG domain II-containing protein [Clostridia bacterium]MBQ2881761.1 NusG domain II-containing protein [Clostridia bacterium]